MLQPPTQKISNHKTASIPFFHLIFVIALRWQFKEFPERISHFLRDTTERHKGKKTSTLVRTHDVSNFRMILTHNHKRNTYVSLIYCSALRLLISHNCIQCMWFCNENHENIDIVFFLSHTFEFISARSTVFSFLNIFSFFIILTIGSNY